MASPAAPERRAEAHVFSSPQKTNLAPLRDRLTLLFHMRELRTLALAACILALAAGSTSLLVRGLRHHELRVSQQLLEDGNRAMMAGQYGTAIEDFRAVLGFTPEDLDLRVRLAQALVAAGKLDEAKNDYLALRQAKSDSGPVNLQLARLQAKHGSSSEAELYYRSAIGGSWPSDEIAERQRTRIELVRFLVSHERYSEARSELSALAENPSNDLPLLNDTASLLLKVGDPEHALSMYQRVLAIRPDDGAALLGAGEAAYAAGRYSTAQRLLRQFGNSSEQNPEIANRVQQRLRDIDEVLSIIPAPGLRAGERGDRALRVWDTVTRRLASCAGVSLGSMLYARSDKEEPNVSGNLEPAYQKWRDLHQQLKTSHQRWALRNNTELQSQVMLLAYDIEQRTSGSCGAPTGADQALLRIAQHPDGIQR
jgi:tetratricopeptide (TPR) repeat protein